MQKQEFLGVTITEYSWLWDSYNYDAVKLSFVLQLEMEFYNSRLQCHRIQHDYDEMLNHLKKPGRSISAARVQYSYALLLDIRNYLTSGVRIKKFLEKMSRTSGHKAYKVTLKKFKSFFEMITRLRNNLEHFDEIILQLKGVRSANGKTYGGINNGYYIWEADRLYIGKNCQRDIEEIENFLIVELKQEIAQSV